MKGKSKQCRNQPFQENYKKMKMTRKQLTLVSIKRNTAEKINARKYICNENK